MRRHRGLVLERGDERIDLTQISRQEPHIGSHGDDERQNDRTELAHSYQRSNKIDHRGEQDERAGELATCSTGATGPRRWCAAGSRRPEGRRQARRGAWRTVRCRVTMARYSLRGQTALLRCSSPVAWRRRMRPRHRRRCTPPRRQCDGRGGEAVERQRTSDSTCFLQFSSSDARSGLTPAPISLLRRTASQAQCRYASHVRRKSREDSLRAPVPARDRR